MDSTPNVTSVTNALRDKLLAGENVIGPVAVLGSIESIELAASVGFDYVLVDWQHGSWDQAAMRHAIRALDAAGCCAVARPPATDPHLIEWLLDMGYSSLLLPMVNSAQQAESIVDAAFYPPRGQRSQATCRASVHGGADYRATFNEALLIIAMIETPDAVQHVHEIAAVDGIDAVFIGSTDLASSMGVGRGAPELERAIEDVLRATTSVGKIPAIAAASPEQVKQRTEQGFRLFTLASDVRLLSGAYQDSVAVLRDGL